MRMAINIILTNHVRMHVLLVKRSADHDVKTLYSSLCRSQTYTVHHYTHLCLRWRRRHRCYCDALPFFFFFFFPLSHRNSPVWNKRDRITAAAAAAATTTNRFMSRDMSGQTRIWTQCLNSRSTTFSVIWPKVNKLQPFLVFQSYTPLMRDIDPASQQTVWRRVHISRWNTAARQSAHCCCMQRIQPWPADTWERSTQCLLILAPTQTSFFSAETLESSYFTVLLCGIIPNNSLYFLSRRIFHNSSLIWIIVSIVIIASTDPCSVISGKYSCLHRQQ